MCMLDAVEALEAAKGLEPLPSLATLRQVWQEHEARLPDDGPSRPKGKARQVRCKTVREVPKAAPNLRCLSALWLTVPTPPDTAR
jgi:hypothetical protein